MKNTVIIFLLLIQTFQSFSQEKKADSLKIVLPHSLSDTSKIKILNSLVKIYFGTNKMDSALKYAKEAEKISHILNNPKHFSDAYNNLGAIYSRLDKYENALEYHRKALENRKKCDDKNGVGYSYNNLATIYSKMGNYEKALEMNIQGLKVREEINDKKGIADSYINIANVHSNLSRETKALEYLTKALEIYKEINDKDRQAFAFSAIANTYSRLLDYSKAIEFHKSALEIYEETNNRREMAYCYNGLGTIFFYKKEYEHSLKFFQKSKEIREIIGDKQGMAVVYHNIGEIYYIQNNLEKSQESLLQSLRISKEIMYNEGIKDTYKSLAELFEKKGNYKKALEFHVLYASYKDSLISEESTKAITEMETKYETEKKQKEIELLNKENEKQTAIAAEQNKKKNIIILSVLSGLFLVIVFSAFLFNRFSITKKQKAIIEEKQQEITDSITYAKRLQTAILPPDNYWKKHLPESFVIYQPKDIVSGDFYWLENINDLILFAAADCTGHGVSGAMVSVVCSNALNRTVKEFEITEPSKILDKTRELVLETFAKSESDIKDGMDISLCSLNTKTNELLWSGANNPLWYIRENNVNEIKPDKQPIGKTDNPKPFTTHKIELQKGDTVYIFTDGYADQFGGEKGKKFMYKPLKNLLLEIHQQPLSTQKEHLHQHFVSWKGTTEQTDDVLIIGIKI